MRRLVAFTLGLILTAPLLARADHDDDDNRDRRPIIVVPGGPQYGPQDDDGYAPNGGWIPPAPSDGWRDEDEWRRRRWREHEWREHREHERHEWHDRD